MVDANNQFCFLLIRFYRYMTVCFIAALKVIQVQMSGVLPSNSFSTDNILKALSHKSETIQIYSSSWTKNSDFQGVSPSTKEVLLEGVKHVRLNYNISLNNALICKSLFVFIFSLLAIVTKYASGVFNTSILFKTVLQ